MRVRRSTSKQRVCLPRSTAVTLLLAALLPLSAMLSARAVQGSEVDPGSEQWAPGLVVRSGMVIQSGAALHESMFANGAELRPRHTGRQTQVWPMLGGDLGVMSPGIVWVPGSPRIFARGGATFNFAGPKDVTKEGDPRLFGDQTGTRAALIEGQGSATNIEPKSPTWEAGLGVAFEFEAWDRPVRLRTSVEYMRERIKLRGKSHEARDFLPAPNTVLCTFQARNTTTLGFDAVGGGLGLEIDVARAGSIVTSVLGEGRFYRFLGDRSVQVRANARVRGVCETVPALQATADFRYKLDDWAYRVDAGFRLRWQPE